MALEHLAQNLGLKPDGVQSGLQQLKREHTVDLGCNTTDGRLKKFYVRLGASNGNAGCSFSLQSRDTVGHYYTLGPLITLDAHTGT